MKDIKIAMLHYTAPPVVGGVEIVMQHHARLFSSADYPVTIIAGQGKVDIPGVEMVINPLFNSRNAEILRIKKELDSGIVSPDFERTKDEIKQFLLANLIQYNVVIAHNICSLHKNMPLSAALYEFMQHPSATVLVSWHHDLAWSNGQYQPELHEKWPFDILKKNWHTKKQIHVAVSEMRRQEISKLFAIPPHQINTIPSGLDWENFLKIGLETQTIIRQNNLLNAYPFFLLPVRITRRKNIELAMKIMFELRKEYPQAVLVITGPPGPHNPGNKSYFEELLELRAALNLQPEHDKTPNRPQVIFLAEQTKQYLPDEVIADLFRFADALLFPSMQEGFGIPVLEAGLAGLPVFCSNIPPFRETAGKLAHFFNIEDNPSIIANQIISWLKTNKTNQLKSRVKSTYSWDNIFQQMIQPLIDSSINNK